MSIEDPFLSPDSSEHKGLVDPDKLLSYIEDTPFEDESAIAEFLSGRYKMNRRDDADYVGSNQTREFNVEDGSNRALSGLEPRLVFEKRIKTLSGEDLELAVYKVTSPSHSVYEYTLVPIVN